MKFQLSLIADICRVNLVEFEQFLKRELAGFLDPGEAFAVRREIMHHLTGRTGPYTSPAELSEKQMQNGREVVERLRKHEPLQYILGKALFCDFEVVVNNSVLIPRPETAELPGLIKSETEAEPVKILDIGTGSGCLAIALGKVFPSAEVSGCDVSLEALQTANQNGIRLGSSAAFFWTDMNTDEFLEIHGKYDLIVSNPPYISISEEADMSATVKNHEPHLALFAPADDPLHFYRRIAVFAADHLEEGGSVWVEINPLFADETSVIFKRLGMSDVRIYPDMSGKDRFIGAFR